MPLKNILKIAVTTLLLATFTTAHAQEKVTRKPVEPFFVAQAAADASYAKSSTYVSPLKEAPLEFSSIGAVWDQQTPAGTRVHLDIRLKSKNGLTDWYEMDADIDHKAGNPVDKAEAILTSNTSTHYQYRVTLETDNPENTPVFENLELTFINGGTPQEKSKMLVSRLEKERVQTVFEQHEDIPDNIDSDKILRKTQVADAEKPVVFDDSLREIVLNNRRQSKPKSVVSSTSSPKLDTNLSIITRSAWGADESLRILNEETAVEPVLVQFEDDYYTKFANELKVARKISTTSSGEELTWPMTYPEDIKKIIIHHTATTKHLDDPARAIRDIYYWHTKSKGWGDIGYNYLIDLEGNIYEGRYGGEMVVGAHAGRGNHGSIGISVLGNYQETEPPKAVVDALTALVSEKTQQYNIDPYGASLFRGENYPNIMGHRDIGATTCPGDKLYAKFPSIRAAAAANFKNNSQKNIKSDYSFEFANEIAVANFKQNQKKVLGFKIKNTGKKTWPKGSYLKVASDDSSRSFLRNYASLNTTKLGADLKPGKTAELTITVQATKTAGSGLIELYPVINGKKQSSYLSFPIRIEDPAPKAKYDYELVSINYDKNTFKKGDTVTATIKLRNKGIVTWAGKGDNRVTLGADKPRDHLNLLLDPPSARLDQNMDEIHARYGEIATYKVKLKVPEKDGVYREYFAPVIEGVTWLENNGTYLEIKVGKSDEVISSGVSSAPVVANGNIAATKLDLDAKPDSIRIDLAYRGNPAIISGSGNFALYEGRRKVESFRANEEVTVNYNGSGFEISAAGKQHTMQSPPRFMPMVGTIMRIDNWERRNSWGAQLNNNEFRGILEVIVYDDELHIVNELSLEDYLKGIAEFGADTPREKMKAMMIIARTYARFYMDVARKFPGAPFDLNDDPNYSQKYMGYSFEKRSPETAAAAADTAGMYVTYDGRLIKTPYFSRSNGRTISAFEKWGWTDTPFLQAVDDSHCGSTEFWGHGVGLSGCGATALAQQGKTFEEIIKYYYRGVEIQKLKY